MFANIITRDSPIKLKIMLFLFFDNIFQFLHYIETFKYGGTPILLYDEIIISSDSIINCLRLIIF